MKILIKLLLFFYSFIAINISFVAASCPDGISYCNPNLPFLNSEEEKIITKSINNTNSSNYWDNLDTFNSTQMENNGGILNILTSWLTSFINSWFSGKTTDDLAEGSTNFYDNRSFNQSLTDILYLKLDQSTPQTVSNGVPLLDTTPNGSADIKSFVNKEYVDLAVTSLGAAYYMHDEDDATGYKTCYLDPSSDAETYLEKADLSDDDYIAGWISATGEAPSKLLKGVYDWFVTLEKTSGTKDLRVYWKLIERKSDNSEVEIATSSNSNLITDKGSYLVPLQLDDDYIPDADSRIVGKLYADVSGSGNAPTVRLYYQGDTSSRWEIPANSEVFKNIFVPYSDAVKNVDLGNYNITASYYCNSSGICWTLTELNKTATDTQKTTTGFYLYNDSTTIYFNETQLNITIDARDTDTQKKADNNYLYNDTDTIYFNETKLNNTIDDRAVGTNYYPSNIYLTYSTYDGSLSYSGKVGYDAGNAICNAYFSGSHLCSESEVAAWFANTGGSLSGDAWVIAGGPKYVPANIPVNDCKGFTYDGTTDYLGNYWHFNSNGGEGRAINCATKLKLACCKY